MDDDRIDFSSLDPKKDPIRFERMVELTLAGLHAGGWSAAVLVHQLAIWGRGAVAAAALIAIAAWVPTLFQGHQGATVSTLRRSDPVELVSQWAKTGKVPTEVDPLDALGDLDVQ